MLNIKTRTVKVKTSVNRLHCAQVCSYSPVLSYTLSTFIPRDDIWTQPNLSQKHEKLRKNITIIRWMPSLSILRRREKHDKESWRKKMT